MFYLSKEGHEKERKMKTKTLKHPLLLSLTLLASVSCTDDVDFDMISEEIIAKPSLLLPIANADVTIGYLFDEVDNRVNYYLDEDGDERIELKTVQDSLVSYSLFDLLFSNNDLHVSKVLDLSALNLSNYVTSSEETSISRIISLPLYTQGIELSSVNCNYTMQMSTEGFTVPADITINFGGCNETFSLNNSSTPQTAIGKEKEITATNDEILIHLIIKVPANATGSLGKLSFDIEITDVNNITGSVNEISFSTAEYIKMTGMKNFKRLGKSINFDNPQLFLSYTNNTPLNFSFVPTVHSVADNNPGNTLETETYNIANNTVGGSILFDKSNSNLSMFFEDIPDSLSYKSLITISMPEGATSVTVNKSDSLFLGYSYRIPFEFTLKEDSYFNADTLEIDDIPNIEDINRAKLIFTTENSIPATLNVNLIARDSESKRLYTPIEVGPIITSPGLNEKGKSIGSKSNTTTLKLTDKEIKDLANSDEIIVQVTLTGEKDKVIVPITSNFIKFDFALAAEFELNTNE